MVSGHILLMDCGRLTISAGRLTGVRVPRSGAREHAGAGSDTRPRGCDDGSGGLVSHGARQSGRIGADHFGRNDDGVEVLSRDAVGDGFLAQGGAVLVRGLGDLGGAVVAVFLLQGRDQHQ